MSRIAQWWCLAFLVMLRRGNHQAPIRRRFTAGLRNLEHYRLAVDLWKQFDNADVTPLLLGEGVNQ